MWNILIQGGTGVLTPEGHPVVWNDGYLVARLRVGGLRSESKQAQMNQLAFPAGCLSLTCQRWGT